MEAKHTRRWTFEEDKKEGLWTIVENGEAIMGNANYYPWVPDDKSAWQLIAAASELLEAQYLAGGMALPDFLDWLADRLVHVYKESPNIDFVRSLRYCAERGRAAIAKAHPQEGGEA